MMRKAGEKTAVPSLCIKDADFPSPFVSGLEYSVPARGTWTIVHVGMLVPQAHEIFVCAAGCLRGVVLSAAEMNLTDRFSTVAIEEHNVLDGNMEELLIEGVSDILKRLPKLPKAVLVYSSCIHHFMGCDLSMCYNTLRERFPDVDFTDCYMIPTMRKSGLTPDQIMRRQLYSLLEEGESKEKSCAIVGNCFSIDETSDIMSLLKKAGWKVFQITECKTYEEYKRMAECSLYISTQPVAKAGGDALAQRLRRKHMYLPFCYGDDEIRENLSKLAAVIGTDYKDDCSSSSKEAIDKAKEIIGDIKVVIDYTFTTRPIGLAKLLIQHGFKVEKLFADSFDSAEKDDFLWLKENAPELLIYPTVHFGMRKYPRGSDEKVLALGQKAAYFMDTPYFVNLVENGGLYGFDGIRKLAEMMIDAFLNPKDVEKNIQIKGLECESCL